MCVLGCTCAFLLPQRHHFSSNMCKACGCFPQKCLTTAPPNVGMERQRGERSMQVAGPVPGTPLYTKVRRKTKPSCAIFPSPFHPPGGHSSPSDSFLTIKKSHFRPGDLFWLAEQTCAEVNLIMGGKAAPPF